MTEDSSEAPFCIKIPKPGEVVNVERRRTPSPPRLFEKMYSSDEEPSLVIVDVDDDDSINEQAESCELEQQSKDDERKFDVEKGSLCQTNVLDNPDKNEFEDGEIEIADREIVFLLERRQNANKEKRTRGYDRNQRRRKRKFDDDISQCVFMLVDRVSIVIQNRGTGKEYYSESSCKKIEQGDEFIDFSDNELPLTSNTSNDWIPTLGGIAVAKKNVETSVNFMAKWRRWQQQIKSDVSRTREEYSESLTPKQDVQANLPNVVTPPVRPLKEYSSPIGATVRPGARPRNSVNVGKLATDHRSKIPSLLSQKIPRFTVTPKPLLQQIMQSIKGNPVVDSTMQYKSQSVPSEMAPTSFGIFGSNNNSKVPPPHLYPGPSCSYGSMSSANPAAPVYPFVNVQEPVLMDSSMHSFGSSIGTMPSGLPCNIPPLLPPPPPPPHIVGEFSNPTRISSSSFDFNVLSPQCSNVLPDPSLRFNCDGPPGVTPGSSGLISRREPIGEKSSSSRDFAEQGFKLDLSNPAAIEKMIPNASEEEARLLMELAAIKREIASYESLEKERPKSVSTTDKNKKSVSSDKNREGLNKKIQGDCSDKNKSPPPKTPMPKKAPLNENVPKTQAKPSSRKDTTSLPPHNCVNDDKRVRTKSKRQSKRERNERKMQEEEERLAKGFPSIPSTSHTPAQSTKIKSKVGPPLRFPSLHAQSTNTRSVNDGASSPPAKCRKTNEFRSRSRSPTRLREKFGRSNSPLLSRESHLHLERRSPCSSFATYRSPSPIRFGTNRQSPSDYYHRSRRSPFSHHSRSRSPLLYSNKHTPSPQYHEIDIPPSPHSQDSYPCWNGSSNVDLYQRYSSSPPNMANFTARMIELETAKRIEREIEESNNIQQEEELSSQLEQMRRENARLLEMLEIQAEKEKLLEMEQQMMHRQGGRSGYRESGRHLNSLKNRADDKRPYPRRVEVLSNYYRHNDSHDPYSLAEGDPGERYRYGRDELEFSIRPEDIEPLSD